MFRFGSTQFVYSKYYLNYLSLNKAVVRVYNAGNTCGLFLKIFLSHYIDRLSL